MENFIDNDVVKTAMIDTLDAGKITTIELNANLIKVINLDDNVSFIKTISKDIKE